MPAHAIIGFVLPTGEGGQIDVRVAGRPRHGQFRFKGVAVSDPAIESAGCVAVMRDRCPFIGLAGKREKHGIRLDLPAEKASANAAEGVAQV